MKILSLHARFSSFFSVCFRELVKKYDVRLRMVCRKPASDAPFTDSIYQKSMVEDWQFCEDLGRNGISALIREFQPDAILMSGWIFPEYLAACRKYRKGGGLVIAFSDTYFQGRWKQRLGCLLAPWYLHPSIDVVCVAGERQRQYANKLGFSADKVVEPMLCCNWELFSNSRVSMEDSPRAFIYVGRIAPEKGVDVLLKAYEAYRAAVSAPWGLKIIGSGSMSGLNFSQPGVKYSEFIQPSELPSKMSLASCFILPSRFEPWGVVLQEAAALGLPLIATESCGASVHLIRDGLNGYIAEVGSSESLAERMIRMSSQSIDSLVSMGDVSYSLSKQFTPSRWAQMLISTVNRLKKKNG